MFTITFENKIISTARSILQCNCKPRRKIQNEEDSIQFNSWKRKRDQLLYNNSLQCRYIGLTYTFILQTYRDVGMSTISDLHIQTQYNKHKTTQGNGQYILSPNITSVKYQHNQIVYWTKVPLMQCCNECQLLCW